MSILTAFDSLMDHLGSREDSFAQEVRQMIVENEDHLVWLSALEAAGVDNWEGHDEAVDLYREWVGDEDDTD